MFNYSLFLTEKIGQNGQDNTYVLLKESLERGHSTFVFREKDLFLKNSKAFVLAHEVFINEEGNLDEKPETKEFNLHQKHLIHIRIDPPFDSRYYTAMKILSYAKHDSLIVNDPDAISQFPEKLLPKELSEFSPETLITNNKELIFNFWKEHKDIIIKPLYSFGGRDVFRVKENEENFKSIFSIMLEKYNEQIICQKYLPEIKEGDKRFVFINGKFYHGFNRVPPKGQLQAAHSSGGTTKKYELNEKDHKIISQTEKFLENKEIFLCGLDVIGDLVTEINITCTACFVCFEEIHIENSESFYWNELEKLYERRFS